MSAHSIYQKPCTICGAMVPTDVKRCSCGNVIGSTGNQTLMPEEQALQEEELFESYLAARVEQMIAKLESLRFELANDPTNQRKADRLLQSVQEALSLRGDRDTQAAKTLHAREVLRKAQKKISPSSADASIQSDRPTDLFRAQQAAKANKAVEAFTNTETRICPHCKTVLPVTSALCLCGYNFSRHDVMLPHAADKTLKEKISRTR